jgi:hypothetical protein
VTSRTREPIPQLPQSASDRCAGWSDERLAELRQMAAIVRDSEFVWQQWPGRPGRSSSRLSRAMPGAGGRGSSAARSGCQAASRSCPPRLHCRFLLQRAMSIVVPQCPVLRGVTNWPGLTHPCEFVLQCAWRMLLALEAAATTPCGGAATAGRQTMSSSVGVVAFPGHRNSLTGSRTDAATLIRAANALYAVRRYWDLTHDLDVIGGMWVAIPRDGDGGLVADCSPGGLHRLLTEDHGCTPRLGSPARNPRVASRHETSRLPSAGQSTLGTLNASRYGLRIRPAAARAQAAGSQPWLSAVGAGPAGRYLTPTPAMPARPGARSPRLSPGMAAR